MEYLDEELLAKLAKDYEKGCDLLKVIDPTDKPYESKYEARRLFSGILNSLIDLKDDTPHVQAIMAGLYCAIGCIDVDVDEWTQGENDLTKSISLSQSIQPRDLVVVAQVRALNQLGILWCYRENHEEAKKFLDKSLEAYVSYSHDGRDPSEKFMYELWDLFHANNETPAPRLCDKEKVFELLNTHTYYYLAQVYEKTGEPSKSAEYCHITLSKQLELKAYQPLDWATNAAMLSQHYLVNINFPTAKRHLIAASYVLSRYRSELDSQEKQSDNNEEEGSQLEDDREEMFTRCKADLDRAWGKYVCVLLQHSQDIDVEQRQGQVHVTDLDEENVVVEEKHDLDFPSIEADPLFAEIPEKPAKNFAEARAIFMPGQRFLTAAKTDYYVLEHHCVDHTEIQRDLSRMHKILIYFETDLDRQYKMHKRRVDLLEPVYKELSVEIYTLLVRQLVFELAETYSAMMDIKIEQLRSDPSTTTPAAIKKINTLVELSANCFQTFLGTLSGPDGSIPEKYSEDTTRPALVAYFHLGRLYDKYMTPERSELKLKNKVQTFCCYKQVVDYCSRHPEAAHLMENELPLCQEMVILLPVKIDKMQKEMPTKKATTPK